jgi:hypothetical protein
MKGKRRLCAERGIYTTTLITGGYKMLSRTIGSSCIINRVGWQVGSKDFADAEKQASYLIWRPNPALPH